jgi:catechol 2,3-dioxygenase-like lactoylglutathione lyase family enzyme
VGITGFSNIALKVRDVDAAARIFEGLGAISGQPEDWEGSRRVDLMMGPVAITLFDRALYEDLVDLPEECFLHVVFYVDDLDAAIEGMEVLWGPSVVKGSFGVRRIAFVEAPGGIRVEYAEQLQPPPG